LNAADLVGKPDFVFPIRRLVVFVDGCFWHGCPKCQRIPSSNVPYWDRKIERNRIRDRAVNTSLRRSGWRVLRIWEHQLERTGSVVARVRSLTSAKSKLGRE
jgi:DNA mismatch endonuclease (patch repair protein)